MIDNSRRDFSKLPAVKCRRLPVAEDESSFAVNELLKELSGERGINWWCDLRYDRRCLET